MKKKLITATLAAALVVTASLAGCSSGDTEKKGDAGAAKVDTVEDGKLIVTFGPYMPYSGEEGGKAVGLDGDMINEIAKRLDLDVEVAVTDFAGMLSGVQTHRADVAIGTINWTEERAKTAFYTDDTYYNPPVVGSKEGDNFKTIDDLKGKKIGTVTGYSFVDAIPEIDGAEAVLFPRMEDVVEAFAGGRVDAILLDPLVVTYTAKQRPDIKLQTNYLEAPTPEQVKEKPGLAALLPAITALYAGNESVEGALTKEIRAMYKDGTMAKLITEVGGDPKEYMNAPKEVTDRRIGVDRKDGWTPPSAELKSE
ncbi:amino acid ABC transporter substrate-binding protein [Leucobacter sp. CSA2]|uniref:Amino acid ABC transporter substrate-binding protein n=1 Tax=Leucobacter edaphi TaxID=2796472 RepID=A0A934UYB7_9MICO|nr:transporter substrate-binding domain-containing protein [Leucobacter edaphi]MBK0421922.1 amino acid ABC transporter substrate-binding protein [Leucobacter edaphi]